MEYELAAVIARQTATSALSPAVAGELAELIPFRARRRPHYCGVDK